MDIKNILDNLNSGSIDINVSDKYDILLEYYKSLVLKYIITSERSLYHMLEKTKHD